MKNTLVLLFALTLPAVARERVVLPAGVTPTHYDLALRTDAAHCVFHATVGIDVEVTRPTAAVTLNAADLDLQRVTLDEKPGRASYDSIQQTATLRFAAPVPAGRHRLELAYTGKINASAAGLFYLDYDNGGHRQRALFTQFENSDARRFMPCWDEPNKKATFALTAWVPAAEMPLSNMPVAESSPEGGLVKVRFQPTPRMSTYLLFFGEGDFERASRKVDGVDVGVVVKRGDLARGEYALDTACHVLPYLNDYFGTPYPLPKMDLIAAAGASQVFGAMENWGALFYFERDLLVDPATATSIDRQRVAITVAHEMAHQWFGDLVTMDWWEDLWLNEGFASWMESKATDHLHPEWRLGLGAVTSKQGAMALDARRGTHPVIEPIDDAAQAGEAFDSITYSKGRAIIEMLERYVGPERFQLAVQHYIRRHAYGNAVSDDLWREIDAVSTRKVTDIAHDFTLQPGIPLVLAGGPGLRLRQSRFGLDPSSKVEEHWRVPVSVSGLAPFPLDGHAELTTRATPVVVNEGQGGYFRTLYAPELFSPLSAGFVHLAPGDQLGLLYDTGALAMGGYQPVADLLELLTRVPDDADPMVVAAMVQRADELVRLEEGLGGQRAMAGYARTLLRPVFDRLGWESTSTDDDNTADLRDETLRVLATVGDTGVIEEARRRFERFRRGEGSMSPQMRQTVLSIVAATPTTAEWEELHELARAARTPLEKLELYRLLGAARESALASRALELAFSPEVENSSGPQIVRAVSFHHPDLALDFCLAHLDQLNERLEPDTRNLFVPSLLTESHDKELVVKMEEFARLHIPANARSGVEKAKSSVANAVRIRSEIVPALDAWLAQRR